MSALAKFVNETDFRVFVPLLSVHLLLLAAPFTYDPSSVIVWLTLRFPLQWVGIGLCYHRLLTHKAFKVPPWFRNSLVVVAYLNGQGSIIRWIGKHRIHHRHTDKPGDPHSPVIDTVWYAHAGWLYRKEESDEDVLAVTKDLQRDKGLMALDRFHWLPQLILIACLIAGGAWYGGAEIAISWFVWGVGVRGPDVYNTTWAVNSLSHIKTIFSYRLFETNDDSQNCWLLAPIVGGEWHNGHHFEPESAAHGRKWWEFDPTYRMIQLLEWIGLATEVNHPKKFA